MIDQEKAPYLKLLHEIRVDGGDEVLVLPVGRCLLIDDQDEHGVYVELEQEGMGHLYVRRDDPRFTKATYDDLAREPEYDSWEKR